MRSTCTGCGMYAKICPADNIKISGGRPKWQHKCENCFACYSWCPNNAISICGELVKYNPCFHHPEIALEDMF